MHFAGRAKFARNRTATSPNLSPNLSPNYSPNIPI